MTYWRDPLVTWTCSLMFRYLQQLSQIAGQGGGFGEHGFSVTRQKEAKAVSE